MEDWRGFRAAAHRVTDGVDFVFLDVALHTTKLDSLVEILDIVGRVPAQLCVFLAFLDIPNYRSLVFAVKYSSQYQETPC